MRSFVKNRKMMAWVVMLAFLFTSIMPTNFSGGNSIAEAAEPTIPYVYQFDGVKHYSPYMYNGDCSPGLYQLTYNDTSILAYCCDKDYMYDYLHYYKRVNLEDANYYDEKNAAYIRAIVDVAYPFVKPWAALNNAGINYTEKEWSDLSEQEQSALLGQLITATQFAVWYYANNKPTVAYDNTFIDDKIYNGYVYAQDTFDWPVLEPLFVPQHEDYSGPSGKKVNTQANANINTIYNYLIGLEPIYATNELDKDNKIVISDVNYDAVKLGVNNTYNVSIAIQLNATVGNEDTIAIEVSDGAGNNVSFAEEQTKGKSVFNATLTNVKADAEIKISVNGTQDLGQGVYFYEPVGGREKSQSFVGVASGITPISASTSFKLEDIEKGIELFKYTLDDDGKKASLSGAEFELWKKVGTEIDTTKDILIGDDYVTDEQGKIIVSIGSSDTDINLTDYYFIETKAPTGYVMKDNNPKQVGPSGKVEVENCYNITQVSVQKVWVDEENQDGKRPTEITVKLLADGKDTSQTLSLNAENGWSGTFKNLDKFAADEVGRPVVYSVQEVKVEGYQTEISEPVADTVTGKETVKFVITNNYDPEKTFVNVQKTWDDNDNEANKRPEQIIVDLLADGQVTTSQAITASDNWFASFTDLDKYRNGGIPIVYSIAERFADQEIENSYQAIYKKISDTMFNIINVFKDGGNTTVKVEGTKSWYGDTPEQRPESVTIELLTNGQVTTSQAIRVDLDGNWTYDFGEYPKYDEQGNVITYTVREADVPEGYVSLVSGFDITNTWHQGVVGQFTVEKDVQGSGTPAAGTEYGFRVALKATAIEWTEALKAEKEQLENAYNAAVENLKTMESELETAISNFTDTTQVYTTGSAYRFVMKEDTTSPSVYQYTLLDENDRMEVTTSSALSYISEEYKVNDDTVVANVVEVVKGLANEFADLSSRASVFLQTLKNELGELGAAVQLEKADADALLQAQNRLFDAQVRVEATSTAVYEFEANASTPSAVTLIVKDMNSGVEETIDLDLDDLTDGGWYHPVSLTLLGENGVFNLLKGGKYSFTATAADGVKIEYLVAETSYTTENYEGTNITMNGDNAANVDGNDLATIGTVVNANVNNILFVNNYYKSGGTTPPPNDPPNNPPEVITDEPTPLADAPEDVEIVEPGVPLSDAPEEEMFDDPVPLGDAPATGDTNNAIPFVLLIMAAVAGIAATRRKFN